MKSNSLKIVSSILLAGTLLLNSCQKEKVKPSSTSKDAAVISSEASFQNSVSRMRIIFAALNGSKSFKNASVSDCATVTTDSNATPAVTVINYGIAGCMGADGKTRKGKAIIYFDGDIHEVGTTITISYSDYYEDNDQIAETDTVRNDGFDANNFISYYYASYAIITNNSGTEKDVTTGTIEWQSGESTETTDDDICSYNVNSSFVMPNSDVTMWTTITPVVQNYAPGCSDTYISGIAKCHRPSSTDYTLDFGNGSCDNQAIMTDSEGNQTTVDF